MKVKTLLTVFCAVGAMCMTSCLGMTDAIGSGYYTPGYDDIWYNGYGYGPYYGGYYGPSYGYGPAVPPPPPPPSQNRPPQQTPPSGSGASRPHSPAVSTTPTGGQRPGNNGLPTNSTTTSRPRRESAKEATAVPTTPMNRGRR